MDVELLSFLAVTRTMVTRNMLGYADGEVSASSPSIGNRCQMASARAAVLEDLLHPGVGIVRTGDLSIRDRWWKYALVYWMNVLTL